MTPKRKLNPNYGTGVFRRRLRFSVGVGVVAVDMEDGNHAFRLRLLHDGQRVVDIAAEAIRYPYATCPETMAQLRELVGQPLVDVALLRKLLVPRRNCTHLTDLALLAAKHAIEAGLQRQYDIAVDDEKDGITRARVECAGRLVHDWQIADYVITAPAAFAGKPMMRGFYGWAAAAFGGMEVEAAVALQRGFFVAQSRRYLVEPYEDYPANVELVMEGSCYSYSNGVMERALRNPGSIRDFTHAEHLLLKFQPMKRATGEQHV
ncbi:MAG: DUF2889 domain-containing protein [Rhodocyclales bacterium]|nr:DUF2889 domain-containing protein [Rhodocyclales bacterium]